MKFCPGISAAEEYKQYKDVMRYDRKGVRVVEAPAKRIASTNCRLWYPVARNVTKEKKKSAEILCPDCVRLQCCLQQDVKRLSGVPAKVKAQHQQAQSHYPMMYLLPESIRKRKVNAKCMQVKERRLIKKYVPEEVTLDDKQYAEMCKIHSSIDDVASNEPESIFGEGEQHGAQIGPTLRHVWEEDKRTQHEETQNSFQGDQKRSSK